MGTTLKRIACAGGLAICAGAILLHGKSARGADTATASAGSLTGESTAEMINLEQPSSQRRWHGEFLNWTTLNHADMQNQSGQGAVQNYVGLNYRVGATNAISVRQPFIYSYEYPQTNGTSSDAHVKDLYAEYQDSSLARFWRDAHLILISARVGLPTGEESRFVTKTEGYVFAWLEASKPLSAHLNWNWHLRTQAFNQSQGAYVDAAGNSVGTRIGSVDELPEIEWKITKAVSVTHATGTGMLWYNSGLGVNSRQDLHLNSWSALNCQATSAVGVTVAVSNDADLNPGRRDFGVYRSDETSYHLILSASI